MNDEQTLIVRECAALSMAGEITFGEVIGRLKNMGIERYHADFSRLETTYYLPEGDSQVVMMDHNPVHISDEFDASVVEASVRQVQRGEISYPQFVAQTAAAGCVGYFVLITGEQVQYFGRRGETHTEWFPGARKR